MICAGVVMLALSSCGSGGKEDVLPPTVEVKTAVVEAGGYSQFIYVKASSSWRITITSVDGGEPVDWIIADPSSGSGDMDVTLKVEENKSEKERSAVITVENSAGKASKTISQKAKGSEVKPDPTPSGGNLSPKTGWMELPAIPEGMDAFTHSMTVGSVSTRNYSFLWDYSNLVAPWVAYPLCVWNMSGKPEGLTPGLWIPCCRRTSSRFLQEAFQMVTPAGSQEVTRLPRLIGRHPTPRMR